MNINNMMEKLCDQLGLSALGLEKYYDKIQRILTTDTLQTFSQFFPYVYTMEKDLTNLDKEEVENGAYIYYIRDKFLEDNNLEIISVMNVAGSSYYDEWNTPLPTFNVEAMLLEGAASNIRSALNISTKSFKFLPPNRVKLRGYGGSEKVYITVKIPYPSFGHVPISLDIEFEKLARLDIKSRLYPELKMYDKFDTAEGTVDLKIDDWESALRDRDDLLSEWRNKAYPNSVSRPYTYE